MALAYDRLTILNKLRGSVGDRSADAKLAEPQVFCVEDGDPIPPEFRQPELYTHNDHANPRAFIFEPATRWEFRDDGELQHFSAAAILWRWERDAKRYCLIRRRRHPIGYYTIPAGHVEMGENPRETALREAYEETQLGIVSVEPLAGSASSEEGREIQDECRRGADYHRWHLFSCQCVGEPRLSDEGDAIGWFTQDEIINDLKLNKPTGIFFGELFGRQPRHVRNR